MLRPRGGGGGGWKRERKRNEVVVEDGTNHHTSLLSLFNQAWWQFTACCPWIAVSLKGEHLSEEGPTEIRQLKWFIESQGQIFVHLRGEKVCPLWTLLQWQTQELWLVLKEEKAFWNHSLGKRINILELRCKPLPGVRSANSDEGQFESSL